MGECTYQISYEIEDGGKYNPDTCLYEWVSDIRKF